MKSSFLGADEDASCLSDVVSTGLAPRDLGGVGLREDLDQVTIDLDSAVCLLDCSLELAYIKLIID